MNLAEVLSMLDERRQEPVEDTKRRFQRFPVRGDAQLEPLDSDAIEHTTSVLLRDISRGGVGFLSDHTLEPGALYRLRFRVNGNTVGSQPIAVCFCRLVQDGLYMVGGQFVIEPYLMTLVGVEPAELTGESLRRFDPLDVSDFIDPETELGG